MEVACPVAPADDWVVRTAGEVRAEAERRHPGEAPTCASGISPSGPVHLGNLRELTTPHFVADEVRKQGVPCRHILSRDDDDPQNAGTRAYYPFRPYCAACGRDDTTVTGFDDETTEITYTCACGVQVGPVPIAEVAGKLAWKVDWPMRWAYERVTFEPAGVDHASPGSSFTVGGELVTEIFGGEMPLHFGYAFVGTSGGSSKMSGSAGGAPTPADALEIFEAPLVRWLYARRRPEQSITLAFDQEVGRVYDEWDALSRKVANGTAESASMAVYGRAAATAEGPLPVTPRPLDRK